MSEFKELIHHYNRTTEEDGRIHGIRRFVKLDGGPDALPTRGTSTLPDETGAALTGCICRRIQVTRDPADKQPQYIAYYDTRSTLGATGSINVNPDPASREYATDTEIQGVPGADWVWDTAGDPIEESTNLYKRVQYINFSITRHALTTAQKNTLLGVIRTHGGSLNHAAFEGFAIGQVYFNGISQGGDYIDETGVRRWSFTLTFTARLLTGELAYSASVPAGVAITQDDWLYQYNSEKGRWDKPINNESNDFLYIKKDFTDLLP